MGADQNAATPRVEIAIAVVERDGKFLIGLRPDGAPWAGYWEFPGGKLAPGESLADAARRESLEETGLEVRIAGEYPSADHDDSHGRIRLHFFACLPLAEHRPLPSRFRWASAAQLRDYRFPPANGPMLELLENRPTGR